MKRIIPFFHTVSLFVLIPFLLIAQPGVEDLSQQQRKKQKYTAKIIRTIDQTFGYEIYEGKKMLVRQQQIPGMSGIKGFVRKRDAEKVAKLVIEKLEKGILPPTIQKVEMEKLQVKI